VPGFFAPVVGSIAEIVRNQTNFSVANLPGWRETKTPTSSAKLHYVRKANPAVPGLGALRT
jgi:hypothetical protein